MKAAEESFARLTQSIEEQNPALTLAREQTIFSAVQAWSFVHSLSILLLDGQLDRVMKLLNLSQMSFVKNILEGGEYKPSICE